MMRNLLALIQRVVINSTASWSSGQGRTFFVAVDDDVRVNCPTFRSSPSGVVIVRNSVIG